MNKVLEFILRINLADEPTYIRHDKMVDVLFRAVKATNNGDHLVILGDWVNVADKNHSFHMNLFERINIKIADLPGWEFADMSKYTFKELH